MAPLLRPLAALALAAICVLALAPFALAMQPRLRTFSAGLSQVQITPVEQTLLNYTLSPTGAWGIVNNWWTTGVRNVFLSFYVDGEATASIVVHVPTACGAGFGDPAPPVNIYSSAYFGKAANTSGYSNKIPVPFQRSIVITFRGDARAHGTVWLWARGVESAPLLPEFGLAIPPTARLQVQQVVSTLLPLEFVDIVSIPAGKSGLVLATQLTLTSLTPNALEGCYYLFPDAAATWEAGYSLLATGTEDYFESAFYFDAGVYAQPYSGVTLREGADEALSRISAYKIHGSHDPMVFSDGFMLKWRNGDLQDSQGFKCRCPTSATPGCTKVGDPQQTNVTSYAWVYTW